MERSDYVYIKEAAKFLGVSGNTLRNWEKDKKITVHRSPISNYRVYLKEDLKKMAEYLWPTTETDLVKKQG